MTKRVGNSSALDKFTSPPRNRAQTSQGESRNKHQWLTTINSSQLSESSFDSPFSSMRKETPQSKSKQRFLLAKTPVDISDGRAMQKTLAEVET
jgi:hypothetical protein